MRGRGQCAHAHTRCVMGYSNILWSLIKMHCLTLLGVMFDCAIITFVTVQRLCIAERAVRCLYVP